MGITKKEIKKNRGKKRNLSGLEKLILKGPTWTEEQYKEWLKDSKSLNKWRIK